MFNIYDNYRLYQNFQKLLYNFHNITPQQMTQQTHKIPSCSSRSLQKSSITGLKDYLNASNQFQYTKRRLKILQIIQNRHHARLNNQKMSLQKFQKIKIDKQQTSQEKNNFIKKKKILQQEQKIINYKNKEQRKNKISQLMRQIETEKIQDRNRVREQSQNIAEKILQNKQMELLIKREKRAKVIQAQNTSKQNYKIFFIQKRQGLVKKEQSQYEFYEQREKDKRNEITKISKIQLKIPEKQPTQTQHQFNSYRLKLSEIYGTLKNNSKSSYSIHNRNQNNYMEDLTNKNNKENYNTVK